MTNGLTFGMPIRTIRLIAASLILLGCSRLRSKSPEPTTHMSAHGVKINPHATDRVIIDGASGDWGPAAHAVRRPLDLTAAAASAATSAAEIMAVTERQDAHYVYLRIDLARAMSLYGLSGTVSIEIDGDADEATGADIDGLRGTDFAIDLSPLVNGRVVEGAALRIIRNGAVVKTTDTYSLDFVLLPTYAAQRAELRIARGRVLDAGMAPMLAGSSYRAQVAVHDSTGALRYRVPTFRAELAPLDTARAMMMTDPLARAPDTQFRALVWNVANEGIRDRPEHFRRIIAAIDPDLLILDEVGGVIGRDGAGRFLASLDSGRKARAPWSYTYGGGGGYQRTVIAARTSVTEYPEFKFIPFPDSVARRVVAAIPAAGQAKQRANIDSGVATGGALVTLAGKRVAVFGVDLQSAGNASNSWQEMRRQAEARLIRDQAMAAIGAHGPIDGVIAAGDHNLVGTREPLTILSEIGGAFDGSSLVVAEPLQLDSATAATWEGGGGRFPPGRLDWFSFSGSTMEAVGGFVFDVADLTERWRTAHKLEPDDSRKSSDHRPVVVDLRWHKR
jgi:endonuclease/exonuclease/phosphatase family metal-dependent hydrolase